MKSISRTLKWIFNNKMLSWMLLVCIVSVFGETLALINGIDFSEIIPWWIFLFLAFSSGNEVLEKAVKSLRNQKWHSISVLVSVATIGAFVLGEYLEGTLVLALFALGERMEDYGVSSSKAALRELTEKIPKVIETISGRQTVDSLTIGTIVVFKAGDIVPVDCRVSDGSGVVDESSVTGENLPKAKSQGDSVISGSQILSGYLQAEVLRTSQDSTLQRVQEITLKATQEKANFQRLIERFSKIYTPVVLIASALIFVVPVLFFGQPLTKWLEQALTLLIISCPCALVISTPLTIFAAIGNAAKKGVVVKGGRYLETLSKVDWIGFDKTRTLTYGKPSVVQVETFTSEFSKEDVLACAAGIERYSEHPIAHSIVDAANIKALKSHESGKYESVIGKGSRAQCYICQNHIHFIGSKTFALEQIQLDDGKIQAIENLENQGRTPVLLWCKDGGLGVIGIEDRLRESAKDTIAKMNQYGVEPVILSGDNNKVVQSVAQKIGNLKAYGQLLPQDKSELIYKARKEGKITAMVGDGINDGPALATAHVGIAMGSSGSDLAVETANVVLMNDNIDAIADLIGLARKAWSTIRFNTSLAIVVKICVLVLAAFGKSSLPMAIFSDVGLLFVVVSISLRLL